MWVTKRFVGLVVVTAGSLLPVVVVTGAVLSEDVLVVMSSLLKVVVPCE